MMREDRGNLDRAVMFEDESDSAGFDIQMIEVGAQALRVAIKRGPKVRPPLLLFNGIGANLELAKAFMRSLKRTEAIIFDVPGVGGSPPPPSPYRPSSVAGLAAKLLTQLGHRRADIAGVSWGGGMAQQFAHQNYDMCRKLVLAATSPGALMVPGSPRVLWKMATPRRFVDKGFMRRVAPEIYGGAFRENPQLIEAYAGAMAGASDRGYLYQVLAMTGWTSLPWLWTLKQPTLILAGGDDPIVPLVNARLMARLMPNARLQILDEGHLFMVTRPAETAAIIETFLAE
jgi:poly(3-hydroxyalkanoate) depolymerase